VKFDAGLRADIDPGQQIDNLSALLIGKQIANSLAFQICNHRLNISDYESESNLRQSACRNRMIVGVGGQFCTGNFTTASFATDRRGAEHDDIINMKFIQKAIQLSRS